MLVYQRVLIGMILQVQGLWMFVMNCATFNFDGFLIINHDFFGRDATVFWGIPDQTIPHKWDFKALKTSKNPWSYLKYVE